MILSLKDNSKEQWRDVSPIESFKTYEANLRLWGGYSLEELKEEGVVVPIGFFGAKENESERKNLFFIKKPKSDNPCIVTRNYMGFIEIADNLQVQITSRFDLNEKNYFLHYLLQKVFNVFLLKKTRTAKESFYDLLYYVFPYYLNAACKQGIFRKYTNAKYNDTNIKGPIDFVRYIRDDIPFNGKIAYSSREFSTDNYITQLIRHTIEFIRTRKDGECVLNGGKRDDTRKNVESIIAQTKSYNRNERNSIIEKSKTPVTHPYFTAYEPLRKICLLILTYEKMNCGLDNIKMKGVLFDGASLWEEYLNLILSSYDAFGRDVMHPNNRSGAYKQYLFEGNVQDIYPDFIYKPIREDKVVVSANAILDAKYKKTDDGQVIDRADSFQMLSYMLRFGAFHSYLIYPRKSEDSELENDFELKCRPEWKIHKIGFMIPSYSNDTTFEEFSEKMKESETVLINVLKEKLENT